MRTFQIKAVEIETLKDIVCDVCHKSCLDREGMNFEYATLSAEWGYGSGKDGAVWSCDICSHCADLLHKFIKSEGGDVCVEYCM